ncbi:uncharacterized protein BJ212DRAFT_388415 [Suillus subaureus]|uniref:F-box domain-containing protein n=1 Tax=Suillus subaureus TaxID=48587 RepID=A0A9P7E8S9_9AGAM|nr:uncharacterized protein BJ212DRAFT_388415 [Suillus subaureus]KAG1814006.1 hypothetical protein BJ212DRAFT_388415 [Suillus subaureus]
MRTFKSATTCEPQKPPHVIISENLDLETVTSNVDSALVSATSDGPQNPSDTIIGEDSDLQIVRNGVICRQRQLIEGTADVVQSNTLRGSFSSPIWRLPTEILSEIFLYCLPEDEHWVYSSKLAPLLLTRICRRWRDVAVGLPRLWCRLQLEVWHNTWQERAYPRDDWQTRAFGYDSWLKRSGACPLSLRLKCRTDWSKLQSLLQPYIQQISSLSLDFLSSIGPFVMEDFHALKELTIRQYIRDRPARGINRSLLKLPVNLRRINMKDLWFDLQAIKFLHCFRMGPSHTYRDRHRWTRCIHPHTPSMSRSLLPEDDWSILHYSDSRISRAHQPSILIHVLERTLEHRRGSWPIRGYHTP